MFEIASTLFAQAVPGSNGTQWAVSLTGQAEGTLASIANGEYSITINPAFVFAAANGMTAMTAGETDTFYRLHGDINGDRIVNNADNLQFRKAQATYNPEFDFNADAFINNTDKLQLRRGQAINFFSDGFVTSI